MIGHLELLKAIGNKQACRHGRAVSVTDIREHFTGQSQLPPFYRCSQTTFYRLLKDLINGDYVIKVAHNQYHIKDVYQWSFDDIGWIKDKKNE